MLTVLLVEREGHGLLFHVFVLYHHSLQNCPSPICICQPAQPNEGNFLFVFSMRSRTHALPISTTHLPTSSAKEFQQTTTEQLKLTMSGPSSTTPTNSTDAMFGGIVTEERKIGLTIDLHHFENPSIRPINGRLLQASDQYKKAM